MNLSLNGSTFRHKSLLTLKLIGTWPHAVIFLFFLFSDPWTTLRGRTKSICGMFQWPKKLNEGNENSWVLMFGAVSSQRRVKAIKKCKSWKPNQGCHWHSLQKHKIKSFFDLAKRKNIIRHNDDDDVGWCRKILKRPLSRVCGRLRRMWVDKDGWRKISEGLRK